MRKAVRSRRFGLLLSVSVIAGLAGANAARAQSLPPAPAPPVRSPVDENGVNVATGKIEIPTVELVADSSGAGRLKYTGSIFGANSINSYSIARSTSDALIVGSAGKYFNGYGGVATDGSGEIYLNGVYQMHDGTKVDMMSLQYGGNEVPVFIYPGANGLVDALATKITYSDGEIIKINYKIVDQVFYSGVFLHYKFIRI